MYPPPRESVLNYRSLKKLIFYSNLRLLHPQYQPTCLIWLSIRYCLTYLLLNINKKQLHNKSSEGDSPIPTRQNFGPERIESIYRRQINCNKNDYF